MLSFISYLIMLLMVMVSVAFYTLLERKILGYMQIRKGPNKNYLLGLMQPFADALKLMSKENNLLMKSNMIIYNISPMLALLLMLMFWLSTKLEFENSMLYVVMFIMIISSLSVYVILLSGWASNSKYALLGAYRGMAQTISYEVSFSFMMLNVLMMFSSLDLEESKNYICFFLMNVMIFFLWVVTILAETNRSPFDFSEGESELVSGFNIEYGAGGFTLLFLSEYGNMIFMSYLTSLMFMNNYNYKFDYFVFSLFIMMIFLWARGTFVRFRYDYLMYLAWKMMLPYSIICLMLLMMMKFMII